MRLQPGITVGDVFLDLINSVMEIFTGDKKAESPVPPSPPRQKVQGSASSPVWFS